MEAISSSGDAVPIFLPTLLKRGGNGRKIMTPNQWVLLTPVPLALHQSSRPNRYERANNINPSEFNQIGRILFCTVHDSRKGFNCAYDYLENYKNGSLDKRSYVGLKAELDF
jgi:hypothetical protein